jgi:hypothetical protein
MFPSLVSLVVIVRHAASGPVQCLGLFGAQLLSGSQAPRQLGAAVNFGFSGDRCAEFFLAAGGGVVQVARVAVGGFGGGNTPLQPRVAGILIERGSGRIDSGIGVVETLADVRGTAWAGFGFTHRRLDR